MPDKEDLIRERARAIWESEGRPDGHHERHWSEARAALEAEENLGATDSAEDTNLSSTLAIQTDRLADTAPTLGDLGPGLPEEIDAAPTSDLGGRVKDPV